MVRSNITERGRARGVYHMALCPDCGLLIERENTPTPMGPWRPVDVYTLTPAAYVVEIPPMSSTPDLSEDDAL